jgi:hypothetical protein
MLLPFISPDGHYGFLVLGPPTALFGLDIVVIVLFQIRRSPTSFFPTFEREFYPFSVYAAAIGDGVLFSIYAIASFLQTARSNIPRLWYFLKIDLAMLITAGAYFGLPFLGFDVTNCVAYAILPSLGMFLYANLMFHGCQDTKPGSAFTPLKGGEFQRDTSIGIELNDPLPLGVGEPDQYN